jgi:hypothetical protein
MELVTIQRARDTYGITSNDEKRFMKEFSIRMIEFESLLETIGIQALRKTIEQCVIHFGYPMMHLVRHISESIRQKASSDNCTPHISEWLHITSVNEAY